MLAGTIRAGPAFIALVVEVRPGDLIPSLGSNLVPCGEILKYQPIVFNTKVIEPDEIRGSSISGGETRQLAKGDVVIVPAGVPHWFKEVSNPFLYYVVKAR